jgi:formylglycine-generating enzyme required for sulfatase activity
VLVAVPKAGGGIFCIDRNEVTNADYGAFLASSPSTSGQATECSWNASFLPETGSGTGWSCTSTNYDPTNKPKTPVDCIDWCDAKKYCEWAGKHLCGAIGGGSVAVASFADASKDEWYAACSKGGTQDVPYGTYLDGQCIDVSSPYSRAAPVPTLSCEGGYAAIYDMSGNLAEWEDSCAAVAGAADSCLVRGGSYLSSDVSTPSALCNSNRPGNPKSFGARRDARSHEYGFRCCLDP